MIKTERIINGRYKIKGEYLKCRFSTIYSAIDITSDGTCLVKCLNEVLPFTEPKKVKDARTQLMIEGNVLKNLSHEIVPQLIEIVNEGDDIYLVLEDFGGVTLDSMIREENFNRNEKSLKWIFSNFLDGVSYLHKQAPAIVNGGIHPQSIIIDSDGRLKLVEFSFMTMGLGAPGRTNFRMMSAPRYSSPQQLQGKPPSPADDIYSIGAVMYYLCTGHEPERSLDRLLQKSHENMRELNRDISPEIEQQTMKMMATDFSDRYHSIDDIKNEFGGRFFTDEPYQSHNNEASGDIEQIDDIDSKAKEKQSVEEILETKISLGDLFSKLTFEERKKQVRATPDKTKAGSTFLTRYPKIDLRNVKIDPTVARILPEKISHQIEGILMEKNDFDEVTVAVVDPTSTLIYDHISFISKGKLKPLLFRADPDMIELAQEYVYEMPPGAEKVTWYEFLEKKKFTGIDLEVKQDQSQIEMFDKETVDGPVIETSNQIIKEAISISASDIHLETFEKEMILRYRIDGVLHKMNSFQPEMAKTIVKRLKILARTDISLERTTQTGRISVKIAGKEYDLRVSVIPVPHGESMVMRVLNKGAFNFSLTDLGFEVDSLEKYMKLLKSPHGMILVSGPTGSGKSTTLYASLKEIDRPDRKLLTVEDPIEYEMPGINQVQVNLSAREEEKRVTFSRALREFLRQDPDAILVGEIRDHETAQIAVQAALTGHLLLSTIHTNSAVGIITRLRDMGVAPYLVGSVLVGGIAQRLVKKICPNCKYDMEMTSADRKLFEKNGVTADRVYNGRGCDFCHNYGHKGRIGIYEVLQITPELSETISLGGSSMEIARIAEKQGMKDLTFDALTKAAKGIITIDEVRRISMG